jgi:mono/diheme cytochrome c family protein
MWFQMSRPNLAVRKGLVFFALTIVPLLLLNACSKPPAADPNAQASRKVGAAIFQTRCFVCHGRAGKGDGPASQGISAHPQDFTDPAWQNAVSNEQIAKVIRYGGAAAGKGLGMPTNPDLTDEQVEALRLFIRGLNGN